MKEEHKKNKNENDLDDS
jgi:hypothetical protein